MEAIKTVDLTKKYEDLIAVEKLNLEIEKGELFSLLGVNGAGKTTVIKMLSCLTKPTEGKAFINGYSVSEDEIEVKKIIGVSPQETAVAPNLSVRENLEFICGINGFSKEKSEDSHFSAPLTILIKASSNFCENVFSISSSGVPTARSFPFFIIPTLSERTSASSI